jgi:hypothetical protein
MLKNWYLCSYIGITFSLDEFYFDNYARTEIHVLSTTLQSPLNQQMLFVLLLMVISFDHTIDGAQGKGLQVQNHNGDWIDAIAEPDELVINVGDMLSRHTNN